MSASILIVEEDQSVRVSLSRLLGAHGYLTFEAASHPKAIDEARDQRPDVVIIDLHLTTSSGLNIARALRASMHTSASWLIALGATIPSWDEELKLFDRVLTKPCLAQEILEAVKAARSTRK